MCIFFQFYFTAKNDYTCFIFQDIVDKAHELNKIEDAFLEKGIGPDPNNEL